MTSFFLPWLTLTAQLPFENADHSSTFIGLCLAIGSPVLITYSLALTLFNRKWAIDRAKSIIKRSERPRGDTAEAQQLEALHIGFQKRVESFCCLAVEAQQVPLRASVVGHWLSSLVVSPHNTRYWVAVREKIEHSQRKPTFSLHAQISLATIVWLFTLVAGISAATGGINNALQIAYSTLWVWLIPICWGWIWVGTQSDRGSKTIHHALGSPGAHRAASPATFLQQEAPKSKVFITTETGNQDGISVDTESGLTREPEEAFTQQYMMNPAAPGPIVLPTTIMMESRGDEGAEGPIYTYARVFTWWAFADRIFAAFEATLERMDSGVACASMQLFTQPVQQQGGNAAPEAAPEVDAQPQVNAAHGQVADPLVPVADPLAPIANAQPPAANPQPPSAPSLKILEGNSWQTSRYCRLPHRRLPPKNPQQAQEAAPVPPPAQGGDQGEPPHELAQRGQPNPERPEDETPAPVHAYIGLRSVHSTVYLRMFHAAGVALLAQWGTTGAAIIIAYYTPMTGFGCRSGSYLVYGATATVVFVLLVLSMVLSHLAMKGYQDVHVNNNVNNFETGWRDRTWGHWFLCVFANLTRLLGKVLAVANSVVLVLIALFEFLGMFDNCWCKSCFPNYGDGGYAVIVRSDEDFRKVAQGAWVGGICMATAVCIILAIIFKFSARAKIARNGD